MPGPLQRIVAWAKGTGCEKLIRYDGREFSITGMGVTASGLSVQVDSIASKIQRLHEATRVAMTLDDCQYWLCQSIRQKELPRIEGGRIRVMVLLGITQLRLILASLDSRPAAELEEELAKWIRYMGSLVIRANDFLDRKIVEKSLENQSSLDENLAEDKSQNLTATPKKLPVLKTKPKKVAKKKPAPRLRSQGGGASTYTYSDKVPAAKPSITARDETRPYALFKIADYLGTDFDELTAAADRL